MTKLRQRERAVLTWARIDARSYEDALHLLEGLLDRPSMLVQLGEQQWSINVAADGPEAPEIVSGCGVESSRVIFIDGDEPFGENEVSGFFDETLVRDSVAD